MNGISGLREFGEFRLDAAKRVLWYDGKPVDLGLKEIEILCILTENGGDVVTKNELLDNVWKDSFVEESALSRHIYVLRKTLREHGAPDDLIKTIPRRGYRFAGEVRPLVAEEIAVEKYTQTRTLIAIEEKRSYPLISRLALASGAVLLLAFFGLAAFRVYNGETVSSKINSLAVLPFMSVEGQTDDNHGVGLADVLITRLTRIKALKVRPTSSVIGFDGRDAAAVGRQLEVDAVLEGSIQREGGRVRVTARLVDPRKNSTLWAEQFDKPVQDEFRLQDEIAAHVADALALSLTGDEREALTRPYTKSADAYQLYIQGRHEWNKRNTEAMMNAQLHFRNAIAADPNFALAYVGLADTLGMTQDATEAFLVIEKALELQPDLGEAHATLGFLKMFQTWDWDGAENSFKRSIELSPGYATSHHWYATLLAIKGETESAKAEMRRAIEINPMSANLIADLGQLYYFNREYREAEKYCRHALQISPDLHMARRYLSDIYRQQGRYEQAISEELMAIKLNSLIPNPSDASRGELEERIKGFEEAYRNGGIRQYFNFRLRDMPRNGYYEFVEAVNNAHLGEKEVALESLERAIERRVFLAAFAKADPVFDVLRDEPRFREMIRKMNL